MNLKEKPFYLSDEQVEHVKSTLAGMSTDEKIHQVFCIMGDATPPEKRIELAKACIGGILFRPARPTAEIRRDYFSLDEVAKIPLLHAANLEEGGAGAASDGTYFASQLQIAAGNSTECVEDFAAVCAMEGLKAGVNWTFSPVSDIDINFQNPITNCRTFGSDGDRVAEFTCRFTETIQKYGIAAAAKHYPGDGVDYRDQHLHPTYNSLSADEWRGSYGAIYKKQIEAGLMSVMVGHICQPALEKEYNPNIGYGDCMPGTLSPVLLQKVLRGELGFNGLITTDATIMGGFTMAMPRKKAIPSIIASGCDMIVFSTGIDDDIRYMREGLESGILSNERLDEAVMRILALKEVVCKAPSVIPEVDAEALREKCADKSVTLVKNISDWLPLDKKRFKKIRLGYLGENDTWDGKLTELVGSEFEKRGFEVEYYNPFDDDFHRIDAIPEDRIIIEALNYPPRSNWVTERLSWCPKHAIDSPKMIHEEPYIAVSFANPYHLQDIPRVKCYINAYTATKATARAVVEKLCGESEFEGINPVDPFCGLEDTKI